MSLLYKIINPLASLFPDAQESPPVHLVSNSAVPIFSSSVSATVELAAHMENTSVCDSDPVDKSIPIPQPRSTSDMSFVEYLSQAMHTNAAFVPSNAASSTSATADSSKNVVARVPCATDVSKDAKKKEASAPKQTTIRATAK